MTKTRIFTNGKIYTVNEKQPWAQAVVVEDKRIAYVGDNEGAMAYAKDGAEVEDLGGRLMTPGFIDGHIHAFMAIVFKGLIRIAPTDELADMQKKVRDYIDAHPELDAYMGMGWPDAYFGEGGPNKADLDVICADKPIAILSSSGHVGWCNSKALEILEELKGAAVHERCESERRALVCEFRRGLLKRRLRDVRRRAKDAVVRFRLLEVACGVALGIADIYVPARRVGIRRIPVDFGNLKRFGVAPAHMAAG